MLGIGKATDVGMKRQDKPNEDALDLFQPAYDDPRPLLAVVADGMGGYVGGATASKLVVETILRQYQLLDDYHNMLENLRCLIQEAHRAIVNQAQSDTQFARMGSTVVAAAIAGDQLFIANVGDSRAYLINPNEIRQISYDHSLVGEEVRAGIITPAQALTHPRRNVLTQSITAQRPDVSPFLTSTSYLPGDSVLLCSDGLWGTVTESQIHAVVSELPPQQAAQKLIAMANTNQGPDNISVIIVSRNR